MFRAVLALMLLVPSVARAAPDADRSVSIPLSQWTLKNGMRVVFSPYQQVPAVTVQVWYHVGSKDERPGIRGIAHLFEHMMFKGSQRVAPEEHARLIGKLGGSVNAFTADDLTAYHNTLPRQYMGFAMQLEAERMRHLHLSRATIKSEREVVKEEKRLRMENSPIGRALEALKKLSYIRHPYAWTPAGVMADLKQITLDDCRRFYDRYYVPNNATLIVVGQATEQEVRQAAQTWFGDIPRGEDPPRVTVREPPQKKTRELVARWPSQLKVLVGAYHVPDARNADMAPLQLLSAVLSAGKSSRLHRSLVRKQKVAVAAGGFLRRQEHPGQMMIYAVGLPSQDLSAMRKALLEQVELVAQKGVTAEELTRAKNQLATSRLRGMRTLGGRARQIGMSAILRGDPAAFRTDVEALDRVTPADVKRVAATYLTRQNLSLVLLGEQSEARQSGGGKR